MQAATARPETAIPTHTSRWGAPAEMDLQVPGPSGVMSHPLAYPSTSVRGPTVPPSTDAVQPSLALCPSTSQNGLVPSSTSRSTAAGVGPWSSSRRARPRCSSRRDRPRLVRRRAGEHDAVDVEARRGPGADVTRCDPAPRVTGSHASRPPAAADEHGHGLAVDCEQVVPARPAARRRRPQRGFPPVRSPTTPKARATGSSKRRSRTRLVVLAVEAGEVEAQPGEHDVEAVAVEAVAHAVEQVDGQPHHLVHVDVAERISAKPTASAPSDRAPPPRRPRRARTPDRSGNDTPWPRPASESGPSATSIGAPRRARPRTFVIRRPVARRRGLHERTRRSRPGRQGPA